MAEDQLAEIFVSREEKRSGPAGLYQHEGVVDSGIELGDIEDFMSLLSQVGDDLTIDALVGHQPQAASSGMG